MNAQQRAQFESLVRVRHFIDAYSPLPTEVGYGRVKDALDMTIDRIEELERGADAPRAA